LDIVLFCGIAKPQPLISYLEQKSNRIHPLIFPDHHPFTRKDYKRIRLTYEELSSENKIILTTEKDFQRIQLESLKDLPLFYIPIHLFLMDFSQKTLDTLIRDYIAQPQHKSPSC